MTLETGVRVGKYTIGQKLGAGGFGVLYVARDSELDRDIAIKILRPEHLFKPQVVQRFLQEARAAARISHPGIVTVYESGQVSGTNSRAEGTVYIAMELLAGDTLAARIRQSGRLPIGIAINFCRQMADALAAAHLAGIIHRDLKPQNVFLVRDPAVLGGERVKVLDFGIAKLADELGGNVQTHSLVMLGTPMYMSPEQCKSSSKVDVRSDIYSLGCILFEMLCGRTPFDGDAGELIAKHQLVAPPTVRSIIADIPSELDTLVAAMLAKSPDERPQTMSSVLDVLDAIEDRIAPAPDVSAERASVPDLGNATTIGEAAGARVARTRTSMLGGRTGIIAGAAAAIALGVCGGVVAMRGDKADASKPVEAHAPADAAVIAETAMPAPDAASEDPPVEVDQIAIECKQLAVDRKWADCVACGDRLPDHEKANAVKLACKAELANELVFNKLQAAISKKQLDAAQAHLAQLPKTSVYRSEAEVLVDGIRPSPPPQGAKPAAPATCDAEVFKDKGMSLINTGQHAAALSQFEAALKCADDPYVVQLAFMESCASSNAAKAKIYYPRMTADAQRKFAAICDRQKPPVPYKSASCDAEKAKDKGMQLINEAQHEAALASFEASLKCVDDPYVRQLAFMESCATHNEAKAKKYYRQLSPAQQQKFAQICIRNHTEYQ